MPRTDPHRDWRLGFRKVMSPRIEVARPINSEVAEFIAHFAAVDRFLRP